MHGNQFANPAGRDGTRFGGGFYAADIAAHENADVTIQQILFSDEDDVCRLAHGIRGFHGTYPSSRFDHSQRLVHFHLFISPAWKLTK